MTTGPLEPDTFVVPAMLAPQTRTSVAPDADSGPDSVAPSMSIAPPGLTVTLPLIFAVEVTFTASPERTTIDPLTVPLMTWWSPPSCCTTPMLHGRRCRSR